MTDEIGILLYIIIYYYYIIMREEDYINRILYMYVYSL